MESFNCLPNARWFKEAVIDESSADLERNLDMLERERRGRPIVTFFGSARIGEGDPIYAYTSELAAALGRSGFAILTGGGSGIMAAANEGATSVGAPSLGIRMNLFAAEHTHKDIYSGVDGFNHFVFLRRFLLTTVPSAIVLGPGGLGTLDEMFELWMLIQGGIIKPVPVFCVEDNRGYWTDLKAFLAKQLFNTGHMSEYDLNSTKIIQTGSSVDEISAQIRAKVANFWMISPNREWLHPKIFEQSFVELRRNLGMILEGSSGRPIVSFSGGSGLEGGALLKHSFDLAAALGSEGFAILTNASTGIAAAANDGAASVGAPSLGMEMKLFRERAGSGTLSAKDSFDFLVCFWRFLFTTTPAVMISYPGGLETLNVMGETAMLSQNGVIKPIPLVSIENPRKFWANQRDHQREKLLGAGYMSDSDLKLVDIFDEKIRQEALVQSIVQRVERLGIRLAA